MNNRIGLTPDQLRELTGFVRPRKQVEALSLMGIPFKVRLNGTPFVACAAINPEAETLPTKAVSNFTAF